jgi:hypothetical protein
MRSIINLLEAPLADITLHGDENTGKSFSDKDLKYIKKQIATGVYKKKLIGIPFNLYVYISNDDYNEMGNEYPETHAPTADDLIQHVDDKVTLGKQTKTNIKSLYKIIEKNKAADPEAIHFIMADNFSDQNQTLPTPWMVVHRLLHCMPPDARDFKQRMIKIATSMPKQFLTMKSARDGTLLSSEVEVEMATQYYMTGDIPLNKEGIRKIYKDTFDEVYAETEAAMTKIKIGLDRLMDNSAGKIFFI